MAKIIPLIEASSSGYEKKYKCPYCELRLTRQKLPPHIDNKHADMIPEGYTALRIAFNTINHKDHGECIICKREAPWNEEKGRYERLCGRQECTDAYKEMARKRNKSVYGTEVPQSDPRYKEEIQKKALAHRKISGKYRFGDGGYVEYTGSYEKKLLEYMDKIMHINSYDIAAPGPSIFYMYEGEEHLYISDFLYIPYNLIIEVKDGGANKNNNQEMRSSREKTIAKEEAVKKDGKYNYLRLTDNDFSQLMEAFAVLKWKLLDEDTDEKYFKVNEFGLISNFDSLNESYIFSKDNLYINFDDFKSGKKNICFITGLSGSGKSTIGEKVANENKAEWIELDIFEHCKSFTDDQLKEAGEVFYDYLSSHKSVWNALKENKLHGKELEEEIKKFLSYCISWCKRHKEKKWIIEGVQIYSFGDPEKIKHEPIIFVNASMVKSIIQRWKRNGDGKINLWAELKNEFPQMLRWYIENERDLQKFIKAVVNESTLLEAASKDRLYHLSNDNLDGKTLKPRIPDSYMTKNGYEDSTTPRTSFSTFIDGCLRGMSYNLTGKEFYVNIPTGKYTVVSPTVKQVPDVKITKEKWITTPVKVKCIGKIKVTADRGEPGMKYRYGDKEAELYDWNWEWVEKYDEKSTNESALLETHSKLDPNHKQKEKLSLSSFEKVKATESSLQKYKNILPAAKYKSLKSLLKDGEDYSTISYFYIDNNRFVASCSVSKYDDGDVVIHGVDIDKSYRGHGLSYQLLDVCTKELGGFMLAVDKKNEIAYKSYLKYGFIVYTENKQYYYMVLKSKKKLIEKYMKESMNATIAAALAPERTPVESDPNNYMMVQHLQNNNMSYGITKDPQCNEFISVSIKDGMQVHKMDKSKIDRVYTIFKMKDKRKAKEIYDEAVNMLRMGAKVDSTDYFYKRYTGHYILTHDQICFDESFELITPFYDNIHSLAESVEDFIMTDDRLYYAEQTMKEIERFTYER